MNFAAGTSYGVVKIIYPRGGIPCSKTTLPNINIVRAQITEIRPIKVMFGAEKGLIPRGSVVSFGFRKQSNAR